MKRFLKKNKTTWQGLEMVAGNTSDVLHEFILFSSKKKEVE